MRPRIRTVKPDFFASPTINQVAVGARYVALGLISMADDRGRIHLMLPALRTYVFPTGDVSERQFAKALQELIDVGFAWRYEVPPWTYLWLPTFWNHQRINRPSESSLPPHPDDPNGETSVSDAMASFKEERHSIPDSFTTHSVSKSGTLTASRVGARSDPNPVVVRLSERLGSKVLLNDPQFDTSKIHSDRWLEDMRLLLKDRGGDVAQIERVIDWTQADDFERANVLSPGKLRKRFTALLLKADRGNVVPLGRKETASDWLRDMDAEVIEAEVIEISNGETS